MSKRLRFSSVPWGCDPSRYRLPALLYYSCAYLLIVSTVIGCREGSKTAVPKLKKKLSAAESSERAQAALELGGYGSDASSAVPALVKLLQDENGGVRSAAAYSLREIDTPQARAALKAAQGHSVDHE